MALEVAARGLLAGEGWALLKRLDRIKPFVLQETMVPAAAPSLDALGAIERYLMEKRRKMRDLVLAYQRWLSSPQGQAASPAEAQQRYSLVRLHFNIVHSQFDIFADVMTQRSENETGVWLAGLDVLAADALALPGNYLQPPPVVCYLDRGHGAAIRRARTRLPGGGENPVSVIMVPRERMVSNTLASSLVHEVGHQGAELLDLMASLRPALRRQQAAGGPQGPIGAYWERWLSEILADLWSVSQVGVTSTLGLMGVVSLPRAFVFRVSLDDPHPIPWIRVKISCALGRALYPHPQWARLAAIWESFYPLVGLDERRRALLRSLEAGLQAFASLLLEHRPPRLNGHSLGDVLSLPGRQPGHLQTLFHRWRHIPVERMSRMAPTLAFAMIGQARADGLVSSDEESHLLTGLLTRWAVRSALDAASLNGKPPAQAQPFPGFSGLQIPAKSILPIKNGFTSN